jgi:hypothetical protein
MKCYPYNLNSDGRFRIDQESGGLARGRAGPPEALTERQRQHLRQHHSRGDLSNEP